MNQKEKVYQYIVGYYKMHLDETPENRYVTNSTIATNTKVPAPSVARICIELKTQGLIEKKGRGLWVVVVKEPEEPITV